MHQSGARRFAGPIAACLALAVAPMGCGTGAKSPPAQAPVGAERPTAPPRRSTSLPENAAPEELLAFVAELESRPMRGASREEAMDTLRDRATVSVQAADRILAQVRPGEPLHSRAAILKLEGLSQLGRLGDERADEALAAYAATLVDSPDLALAREARRMLIVADARSSFEAGNFDAAPGLVNRVADLLAADPDDTQTAMLAMQLAKGFEQTEGGEEHAAAAYATFGPLFATSGNDQIRALAEKLAGTLRRLSLPGKPMEITGTLLGGGEFDQKSLAGKVVLVDFWATWCGPCVEEMPNIRAQYEKYHARGFEVVGISLDEDPEAVNDFIEQTGLPWPVIIGSGEQSGWDLPLAKQYGISGIPQLILIGRDGNVITLNARGETLAERLAELFKDDG